MTDMTRREAVAALGAAAAGEWDSEEFDPFDVDGFGAGAWELQQIEAGTLSGNIAGSLANAAIHKEDTDTSTVSVDYYDEFISLSAETKIDEARSGFGVELEPDTARELAVALYMAAAEYEARAEAGADE